MIAAYAIAFAVRLCFIALTEPRIGGYFWELSSSLLGSGALAVNGVTTTQYEPLYPWFLATARALAGGHLRGIAVLQASLDALGAPLLFALANTLTGRQRVAWLAALAFAFDPLLVWHAVIGTEFSLVALLLLMATLLVVRRRDVVGTAAAGVCYGLATLARSAMAPVPLLAAAWLVGQKRGRAALALVATAAAVVFPWIVRNAALNGTPGATRVGLNLFIGTTPYLESLLPNDNPDLLVQVAAAAVLRRTGPLEHPPLLPQSAEEERRIDAWLLQDALDEVRAHPEATLASRVRHAIYFFWPRLVPLYDTTPDTHLVLEAGGRAHVERARKRPLRDEIAYSTSYIAILVAACAGIWIRRGQWRADAPLWCVAVTLVATHAIFFPATRYRVPMEFVLLFYGAVGVDAWIPRSVASAPRLSNAQSAQGPLRST